MPPAAFVRNTLTALLAAACFTASPASAAGRGDDPGNQDLLFEITRNGSPVGSHSVTVRHDAAGLRAESSSRIAVRMFGITVYRLDYTSVSRWTDGRMVALDSVTDDAGTVTRVSATLDGDDLRIATNGETATAPLGLQPTDHWNSAVIGATEVLNTLTGKINRVTMTAQGRDNVPAGGRLRPATRYAYHGELEATVWYDAAGHWTGLRFAARDGSIIDYVCRRCGPDAVVAERPR